MVAGPCIETRNDLLTVARSATLDLGSRAFRNYDWDGDRVAVGSNDPMPELRQTGPSSFVILKGFCYRVAAGDPEAGTVYAIPGEDADRDPHTRHAEGTDDPPARVVIPPTDSGGATDLASVRRPCGGS